MDERIKQGYQKIYSELFSFIFLFSALSLIVKTAFFNVPPSGLLLEYCILIGSPVYQLIRGRMMKLALPESSFNRRVFLIRLVSALCACSLIFLMTSYFKNGHTDFKEYAGFLLPFLLSFTLVGITARILQKRWNQKLEEDYKD